MSPRRNRRDDPAPPGGPDRAWPGAATVETWAGGRWHVRTVPAPSAAKAYRCPGCDHEIAPGTPHVVAWPADDGGDLADRRHWHSGCWRARSRRRPPRS
ncbi:hypothetical protein GCM10010124_09620 [Pilimelia terevasa]|uniref:ATP/GTP-binding protein n=1 Tax=Pilimelia terevasa TaxID=53372 RepID=A0A8J3BH30_9ACTN|nr:hypothetical protein [Pilimelia terevasa]GGK19087.1 hypothetical protein GCM10010124_09620 [Pilimelia terevasa]